MIIKLFNDKLKKCFLTFLSINRCFHHFASQHTCHILWDPSWPLSPAFKPKKQKSFLLKISFGIGICGSVDSLDIPYVNTYNAITSNQCFLLGLGRPYMHNIIMGTTSVNSRRRNRTMLHHNNIPIGTYHSFFIRSTYYYYCCCCCRVFDFLLILIFAFIHV